MSANDWGVRLSQFGYDVKTAADYQLIFSSSWPLLKIEHQSSFTIPNPAATATYTHGLGYPPLVLLFDNTTYPSLPFSAATGTVKIDSTKISININSANVSTPFTGYLVVFRHSLEQNYQAPIINGVQGGFTSEHDWGLKISKTGKDVSSTDLRDFVIHSSTRSPMIQNVTWGPLASNGTDFTLVATHSLNYGPWFLCFLKQSGNAYYESYFGGAGTDYLKADTTTVTMHKSTTGHTGSIFVFKDPFSL